MATMLQAIAAPCLGADPYALIDLAVQAEEVGFDGFFIWDHMLFANDGDGPELVDPWAILAVIAARTSRIRFGPLITPLSRRRPWMVARQCATLDALGGGRLVLGAGLGSPAEGDFGRFGEVTDDRTRAELLDEALAIIDGLWSGERFRFDGAHYQLAPMRFLPRPIQRPRIPVWIGGVLPNRRPIARAARWDGVVPIRFADGRVVRPSVADIAWTRDQVAAHRPELDGFDLVVWSEIVEVSPAGDQLLRDYQSAGATWWIETGRPAPDWWSELTERVRMGPR